MAFSIGSIGNFDASVEDFESYCSRVDLYFIANNVTDKRVVPTFLTLVGPKVYGLAKNLLSPKDPADCTYDEIKTALRTHFKPKVILIYERFKFHSRSQKPSESVSDFIAALKELAHTCEFGATLNDMLRGRFVTGLSNAKTQHTLLAEADLTFARAVEIATAREAAQKDIQAMGNSSGTTVYKVRTNTKSRGSHNHKSNFSSKEKSKNSENSKSQTAAKPNAPASPCSGCGKLHWKKDCPFKGGVCYACNRKGHIKPVCRVSKSGNSEATENVNFSNINVAPTSNSSYDNVFNINSHVPSKPIVVKVCLNDKRNTDGTRHWYCRYYYS